MSEHSSQPGCQDYGTREYGCTVSRQLVGRFMTSFNMHGATLTVLNLTGASAMLVVCLDASTTAPSWMTLDVSSGDSRPSATEIAEVDGAMAFETAVVFG